MIWAHDQMAYEPQNCMEDRAAGTGFRTAAAAAGTGKEESRLDWIIPVSVAIIAAAFVVLVVYVVRTLKAADRSLNQVRETLVRLERQVDELGRESANLIRSTNRLTEDINQKIRALDSMFQSANQVGDAVREVTSSVKQVSAALSNAFTPRVVRTVSESGQHVSEIMQWVSMTMGLVQKWRSLRKSGGPPAKQ
jgi:uncharacterized protein YoxC